MATVRNKMDSYPSADGEELSVPLSLEEMDGKLETRSEHLDHVEAIIGDDIKMERRTSEHGDNPIFHIDIKENYTLNEWSWQEQDPLALSPKIECQFEFVENYETQHVKTETDKATLQPSSGNAGDSAICQHSITTSVDIEEPLSTSIVIHETIEGHTGTRHTGDETMGSYPSAGSNKLLLSASLKFMDGESENCTELLVKSIVEDNIKVERGISEDSNEPIHEIDIKEEYLEEEPSTLSPKNEYTIELDENVETQNLNTRIVDKTILPPKSEHAGESSVSQPSIISFIDNRESPLSTKIGLPETIEDYCSAEPSDDNIAQPEPPYQYHMGSEAFNKNDNPVRHFSSQRTGEKPYQCHNCGKAFSDEAYLIVHDRTHTGEKRYQCPTCCNALNQKFHLNKHCRQDTCGKHYHCHICSKAFNNNANLVRHISTQHVGGKPYQCHTCAKAFSDKAYLAVHVRTHTGEKPYQCPTCSSAFSQKSHLNTHCRQHTGEKNYHCHMCSKAFNQKIDLIRHYRQHTGEKPYQCDTCSKDFSHKSHLMTHCRIHTGEKPYQCDICSKRFNQMSKLARHCRKHTGEKPYQCPTCSIAFSDKTNLKRHSRQHTGEKPYQCPTCSVAFSDKSSLTRHSRQHIS